MSIKFAIRRVALTLPPLRRLYKFAVEQAAENANLVKRHTALETKQHAMTVELETSVAERESLELQLYVMRSDHQRAATRNESLAALLRESKDRENELEARFSNDVEVSSKRDASLELFYAKLAGRLTMLSSEVAALQPKGIVSNGIGAKLYLDLLEDSLTGILQGDHAMDPWSKGYDPERRAIGRDWPSQALTMIGSARLRNLRVLAEQVLRDNVPGDMIEAGVWRGGACILMRGVLAVHGITDRAIWVADSFEGLPPPEETYPADKSDAHSTFETLSVSIDRVRENFQRYDLLDEQVQFLKGWFKDTLAPAPIKQLSILRLDGDMYSSAMQTMDALYEKVVTGGYVIVDDYILKGCHEAVDDFRKFHNIRDPLQEIDGAAVFWRKS